MRPAADAVFVQPFERYHPQHPDYPALLSGHMLVPPTFGIDEQAPVRFRSSVGQAR